MNNKSEEIKFLSRDETDLSWWNNLIRNSTSPLIYAEAEYLDFMSPGWSAFYHPETESVMPFPLNKKAGISYALQPPFIQQLGIFSKNNIHEGLIRKFISAAADKASLIDLHFNYNNQISGSPVRTNFIIRLNKPFSDIQKNFRKDLIRKSSTYRLNYSPSDLDESFAFYRKYSFGKTKLGIQHLRRFQQLCRFYETRSRLISRKIVLPSGESAGISVLLKDEKRIYYMLSASSPEGRKAEANAFLLHEVIREFSGTHLIFDFEGSEIPGVRFFFRKFSPELQPYFPVHLNKLSMLQKGLIRIRNLFR